MDFVTSHRQGLTNLVDLTLVAGFHLNMQVTAIDISRVRNAFMINRHHVGSQTGDDLGDLQQLSRLIHQLDLQTA